MADSTDPQIPDMDTDAAPQLPENDVQVEDAGTLKKKVTVTVPPEAVAAKRDEMFGELSQSAQVPGFRVGRAPRRLLEKRFGKEVGQDVRNALIGESIGAAIEKSELKTIGEPDLDLDAIELPESGPLEFSFEVEVSPEFDLPELEGLELKKPAIEVNDERVDQVLDNWRSSQVRYEDTDEPADEGDGILAGAKITGEGIEDVERHGVNLRVAPGQIEGIPLVELAEELKGVKAGDTVALETTVSDQHPNEDWRGKTLKIELTVSQVRRRVLPEIDDDFAATFGFDSVDQLRDQVRSNLQARVAMEAQQALRQQACNHLVDNTEFDLPEGMVTRHTNRVLQRRYVELLQQGLPRERIDEHLTELKAAAAEQAQRDLKLSFILSKVAEEKGVIVADEEINARVAQMAAQYNRRPERLRQELAADGSLEAVADSIREDKALDAVIAEAKIEEVSEEEARAAAEGSADQNAEEKDDKKKASAKKKAKKSAKKKSAKKSKADADESSDATNEQE